MRSSGAISGSCILAMLFSTHFALGQTPGAAAGGTPDAAGESRSAASNNVEAVKVGNNTEAKADDDSSGRDYSRIRNNSLVGGFTGLMHTVAADSGAPGTFRLSFMTSNYGGSGFICPSVAACGLSPASVSGTEDSVRRNGQDVALSATLTRYLEASIALRSHATSDTFATPNVLQALGDTYLGLKFFTPRKADQIWSVGGLGQLRMLSGSGGIGFDATNIAFAALGTLDLSNRRDPAQRIPLRLHANFGYLFDNSGKVASSTEQSRGQPISRFERFALDINRVDSVLAALGGEYVGTIFQPFAEWSIDITANRQGYACSIHGTSPGDACLVNVGKMAGAPSRLTFGTRVTPPIDGFSATLALDVGTSATSSFVMERAPEIPWNFYLGVGYAIDTYTPAPVPVVAAKPPQVIRAPRPTQYHLVGKVIDDATAKPVAHALIELDTKDAVGLISLVDGTFETGDVAPGEHRLSISADGYRPSSCTISVMAAPNAEKAEAKKSEAKPQLDQPDQPIVRNVSVDCPLKVAPALGTVRGIVLDAESGAPVAAVQIKVRDERHRAIDLQADAAGSFSVSNVPVGKMALGVSADGYLPSSADADIKKNSELYTTLTIRKLPKNPNVTVTATELKLKGQVRFVGTTSNIEPDSTRLIQEVAAVLLKRSEIASVEIHSYTDDSGNADFDKSLSEERGQSVKSDLINLGVDSKRVRVVAHGHDQPLAPNTNEASRMKNRRIKFTITKVDAL